MKLASLQIRQQRFQEIAAIFAKEMPDPRCELYYETPYQLLVSVVLSAQANDKIVNRCMRPLYETGFGPKDVLEWGYERLLAAIRTIGLAPTKARNVLALTALLVEKHNSEVPNQREALEALPGVGRKTANVVLGGLFRQPTLAVDTHVLRVGQRLGLHAELTPDKAERALLAVIPATFLPRAHHWFVLHGRYICQARRPLCATCSLQELCPSAFKAAKITKKKSKA